MSRPPSLQAGGRGTEKRTITDPLLGRAMSLHQAGRLDGAEQAYRRFLSQNPRHAFALQNLGLLLHQLGRFEPARTTLARAVEADPRDAGCRESLGRVLKVQGYRDEAIAAFRAALELAPEYTDARYQLGTTYHDQEQFQAAAECYEQVLAQAPGYAPAWNSLGSAYLDLDNLEEAERCLRKATEVMPGHPGARLNFGVLLKRQERFEEAIAWLGDLVRDHPTVPEAHNNLAISLHESGRLPEAERAAAEAVRLRPGYANAWFQLANVQCDRGKIATAIAGFRRCVELDPENADAWAQLGIAWLVRGEVQLGAGAVRRALEIAPDHPAAHNTLGFAHSISGDAEAADACFARALELQPDFPAAWLNVTRQRRFTEDDRETIAQVESIPERTRLRDWGHSTLHFALGNMYRDVKDYPIAFDHFRQANRLARDQLDFDIAEWTDKITGVIDAFNPHLFECAVGFGDATARPIFIFGMPRSGTTLVEQILSSHPAVHGAGELLLMPDVTRRVSLELEVATPYPESVAMIDAPVSRRLASWYLEEVRQRCPDEVARVTDKLPGNYAHLGMIALLFPNATLIHCQRDPMDVCLSNYMQRYGEGHVYSYDLTELGLTYRQYERVMAHWHEVLPIEIFDLQYETMVAEQQQVSRALVEFCALEWDDRCLHYFDNARAVQTASQWQVRRPIYGTSVQGWKRYAQYLDELRVALGMDVGSAPAESPTG